MTSPLPIARTVADLRSAVAAWKAAGERVALVPTMGALHAGHLSLVEIGKRHAARVVTSIFVNPTQFAPHEDFTTYPRDEAGDVAQLASAGCDLVFAPEVTEMYRPGASTVVTVSGVSAPLEGVARPDHFAGVATVVTKLLLQAGADIAVFGEKDYQQLQVIRRLAADLDVPTTIVGAPTLRAEDGLALSSRNAYLSPAERAVAGRLNVILKAVASAAAGGKPVADAEAEGLSSLRDAGFDSVDYLEIRAADDLSRQGPGPVDAPARVLVAARIGRTRLIDNMPV